MARGRSAGPAIGIAAMVVGFIVLIVGTIYAVQRDRVPAEQVAAASASQSAARAAEEQARADAEAAEAARIDIAVLGDSYTDGSSMDSGEQARYPALLTAQYPWNVDPFAVGGTGFVNGIDTGKDFPERVAAVVADAPDVVIVEGGHNDNRQPGQQVSDAISQTLNDLRAGLPQAQIVVLSALWPGDSPPQSIEDIDAELQAAATAVGGTFVSTADWFAGANLALIGSDGTHPTDAGHTELARRIGDALIALGVPTAV